MTALSIILNIVLILVSIVLVAVVLMQQGQRQGLGAISGGAETFFGKGNAKGLNEKLAKITKVAAVAFIVLAIACTIVVSHIEKDDEIVVPETVVETVETEAAEEPATEVAEEPAAEAEVPATEAEASAVEEAAAEEPAAEAAE